MCRYVNKEMIDPMTWKIPQMREWKNPREFFRAKKMTMPKDGVDFEKVKQIYKERYDGARWTLENLRKEVLRLDGDPKAQKAIEDIKKEMLEWIGEIKKLK
jgi:hypothetical protein